MDPVAKRYLYEEWGVKQSLVNGLTTAQQFDAAFAERLSEDVCVDAQSTEKRVIDEGNIGFPETRETCDYPCMLREACYSDNYKDSLVRKSVADCVERGDSDHQVCYEESKLDSSDEDGQEKTQAIQARCQAVQRPAILLKAQLQRGIVQFIKRDRKSVV